MRRLTAVAAVALLVVVAGGAAADTFAVTLVSQTNSTITLGWAPQPGYGYLFSSNGTLVSRTNDPSRSSVKFSKNTANSYDIDVIVKGANGHYPAAAPPPPPPPPVACADGVDNDADGLIDLADPGCSSPTDTDETNTTPPPPPSGYPDASNTGVPTGTTLTAYTGPSRVTTANTVISGKTIGCIEIAAANVVIRNSKISCNGSAAIYIDDRDLYGKTPLLVEDSEIDCKNSGGSGVGEAHYTLRRVEITGCENGLDINQNVLVEDSYIHALYSGGSEAHEDGAQIASGRWNGSTYIPGGANITFRHNTIYGMSGADDGRFGTSAIIGGPVGTRDVLIENNLLAGGAYALYCVRGATPTNYRVIGNHFSTRFKASVGFYGISSECGDEIASGNVIHETGQPIGLGG